MRGVVAGPASMATVPPSVWPVALAEDSCSVPRGVMWRVPRGMCRPETSTIVFPADGCVERCHPIPIGSPVWAPIRTLLLPPILDNKPLCQILSKYFAISKEIPVKFCPLSKCL